MKKLIMFLIFAMGVVFIADAQEGVPQEEQIFQQEEVFSPQKEGKFQVDEADIPQAIQETLTSADYQGMVITEAYEITGEALNEIPTITQEPKPDKLYELWMEDSTRSAILYFNENGELYDMIEKV